MKMSKNVAKYVEEFYAFEKMVVEESLKFELSDIELIDLFTITEMYQRDKEFTVYTQKSLEDYKELKRSEFNL